MGLKLAALFLLLSYFMLLTASSSAATRFDSVEVQERKVAENGVNEDERTGHGGRGDGGGGYAGSQGGGNGNSSPGLQQPGTTLQNGGGTAYYRNHPRRGAAVHNYNCNLCLLAVFITVSFSLLLHVSFNF
ncbi:unnamed protein product [Amaranthus hypochondriacus]